MKTYQESLTELLRNGNDPFWHILRSVLKEKNIDHKTTYLPESNEEGHALEYGIIVTEDKKIYEFYLRFTNDKMDSLVEILKWDDITKRYNEHSITPNKNIDEVLNLIDLEENK